MLLNRQGNKKKWAKEIIKYFPKHETLISLFFGSGAIEYLNNAKYTIANDFDKDVYNLYKIVEKIPNKLHNAIKNEPYHEAIYDDLKKDFRKHSFKNRLKRAKVFLQISNYSLMGRIGSLKFTTQLNTKQILLSNILKLHKKIINSNINFTCDDYSEVLKKIQVRDKDRPINSFIYADPPYYKTGNNYSKRCKQINTELLIQLCIESGLPFAISEFEGEYINSLIEKYNLTKILICNRKNLNSKERQNEILIVNYKTKINTNLTLF